MINVYKAAGTCDFKTKDAIRDLYGLVSLHCEKVVSKKGTIPRTARYFKQDWPGRVFSVTFSWPSIDLSPVP